MSPDPNSAQSPVMSTPDETKGSTGFTAPIPTDMRFASDHSSLAPHQSPELPSEQIPSSLKPDLFKTTPPPKPLTPQQPIVIPSASGANTSGQQITLTINPSLNQPGAQISGIPQSAQQPMVQINVQSPNTTVAPATSDEPSLTPPDEVVATAHAPRKLEFLRWLVIIGLAGIGMKGFFDSLYFIFVEFQNFEKALEDHLIETAQVNPLILKAALLIFATAVCVFFGMQLTMTKSKNLRFFRILGFLIVGVACAAVLQHASTINVLDSFKTP